MFGRDDNNRSPSGPANTLVSRATENVGDIHLSGEPVSYTHLTLPTILRV